MWFDSGYKCYHCEARIICRKTDEEDQRIECQNGCFRTKGPCIVGSKKSRV